MLVEEEPRDHFRPLCCLPVALEGLHDRSLHEQMPGEGERLGFAETGLFGQCQAQALEGGLADPMHPDLRRQLKPAHPDLTDAEIDSVEELLAKRFTLDPQRDAEALRTLDAPTPFTAVRKAIRTTSRSGSWTARWLGSLRLAYPQKDRFRICPRTRPSHRSGTEPSR